MSILEKLAKAQQEVAELLVKGHIAKVEETYLRGNLVGVSIHHYPMCRQCVKERKEANGKERKV